MEIIKEKQIENLVKNGVIIATQEYLLRDNEDRQKVGNISRESYGNWESDRERLLRNEAPEIVNAVLAIWGDVPTLAEPEIATPSNETEVIKYGNNERNKLEYQSAE